MAEIMKEVVEIINARRDEIAAHTKLKHKIGLVKDDFSEFVTEGLSWDIIQFIEGRMMEYFGWPKRGLLFPRGKIAEAVNYLCEEVDVYREDPVQGYLRKALLETLDEMTDPQAFHNQIDSNHNTGEEDVSTD